MHVKEQSNIFVTFVKLNKWMRKPVDLPGPKMTAFHTMILSGHGLPEIPPGGSVVNRLKSRIRRRRAVVD